MIDLKQLVSAINDSVSNAAAALRAQNLEILGQFFEDFHDLEDLASLAEKLESASAGLAETDDPKAAGQALRNAVEAIQSATDALKGDGETPKRPLQPKMVVIKYPIETSEGPAVHPVTVPLIALAPASSFQLSSLRFTTELDVELVDDVLQVGFPGKRAKKEAQRKVDAEPHRATLEIEIDSAAPPRGLEILVEGYERALRAQIPG